MRTVARILLAEGFTEPLVDANGVPYRSHTLPCVQRPTDWDEDAPMAVQRASAAACYTCPARDACLARWVEWGAMARGVWAGIIVRASDTADDLTVYDATVASWLVESGIATPTGG